MREEDLIYLVYYLISGCLEQEKSSKMSNEEKNLKVKKMNWYQLYYFNSFKNTYGLSKEMDCLQ